MYIQNCGPAILPHSYPISLIIVNADLDANNETFFKEVFKVPAANYFVIKKKEIIKKRYWSLKLSEKKHFKHFRIISSL